MLDYSLTARAAPARGPRHDCLSARLGLDVRALLGQTLDELIAAGCLEFRSDRLRVTDGSIMVTSELLVRLDVALADSVAVVGAGAGAQ